MITDKHLSLFPNDHNPPHLHIDYAEYHALIDIANLEILKGEMPAKILKKATDWASENKNYLIETFAELNPNLR